ncbi:bifunctional 5,10-methylenetetrahydrofolate dehydrogenase/5,10-methenyltetrahydrofolate cyclohydrolase [Candidatus Parcubacteria bacterium]|jgi:methylenetetrahydrofolate dehydrogenase (NADP+)/methenyltetrahydrofolate cyclohydrolase|nr:MAG: bifunctional 5,10-methylenetetrahydrofolate dehydrogenase/5,10-methenyltetrahydrofolate cyclohydrolase [Candidatus Parcubacteria bacterium]
MFAEFFVTRYYNRVIIDGRKIAKEIIDRLKECGAPKKFLGVIFIGNNSASERFVQQKKKIAEILGVDFRIYQFPEPIRVDELRKKIGMIGRGKTCGGLIVQLPLPSHLNRSRILNSIPKGKDLDVLSESAYEQFLTNQKILPPSVSTFCEVLSYYQLLENHAYRQAGVSHETSTYQIGRLAVVGNGFLVGKPISDYLRLQGKQFVVLDKGDDLSEIKNADVVVLGTGVSNIIDETIIKDDALVIDFGCSFISGKLCGDLLFPTKENFSYTPTPGGTGPILVAKLFENFYRLNVTN